MFVIRKNNDIWWPILIHEPDPDNPGETREVVFEAKLRLLKRSDWRALNERVNGEKDLGAKDSIAEETLLNHILDWRQGPFDEEGNQVPFTRETLKALLDHQVVERAFTEQLLRASNGRAARGNSKAG